MLGALHTFGPFAISAVPAEVRERLGLMSLPDAFVAVHLPGSGGERSVTEAKRSLAFDELFMLETGLALRRRNSKRERGIELGAQTGLGRKSWRNA